MQPAPDIKFELQHKCSGQIAPLQGAVARTFARSAAQGHRNAGAVVLGKVFHDMFPGQVLPREAIGVLVGPAFPGVMEYREMDPHTVQGAACGTLAPGKK